MKQHSFSDQSSYVGIYSGIEVWSRPGGGPLLEEIPELPATAAIFRTCKQQLNLSRLHLYLGREFIQVMRYSHCLGRV